RLGAPLSGDIAGQKLGCSVVAHDAGDEPHRFTAISATLTSLVDQQLPLRAFRGARPTNPLRWEGV
ncbi:MAG: hypothetical protein ACXVY6_05060, partial [Gaiellaceae bacterium]